MPVGICAQKYSEPTAIANVETTYLSGNAFAHLNTFTRP